MKALVTGSAGFAAGRPHREGLRAECMKAVRELGMPQSPIATAVADAMAWFGREGYL
jgi:hypothetical protein